MDTTLFNAMFQKSAISIVFTRLDGRFLYMNEAFSKFLGYKKEELINETYKSFTHEDDIEETERKIEALISGRINNYQLEKRFVHKSGHIVWGMVSVSLIHDQSSSVLYMMGQIENITEKKQVEAKLVESERRFRLIAENSSDRIIILTQEGKYDYVSPALTDHLGYENNELKGLGPLDLIYVDDKPIFEKALRKVIDSNVTVSISYRIQHKEGYYRWSETNIKSIKKDDDCKEILLISRDISERKKIEEKLHDSIERIHIILESISDGFVALDNEARFIYVNRAAVSLLNKSRDKLLGYKCMDVLPEFITTELLQYYESVKAQNVAVKFEIYSELLDATFAVRMYPMKDIVSVYFLDITEQKRWKYG
ncbi:PAS domain S-box protein [Anaerobacillus sp. CMMVII]|uniref:PAS domain-containing protein n=1 Tax=Anaerobacillus sp. CMMVII TaxID=2755588 RepID=UPI0021B794DF|nr:PAS domain S-box protein [Anaerobacillus sp. CMMVII]MCT8137268.1 PAS domain S-box protein [Anaerobacillus sp. CMMVII]